TVVLHALIRLSPGRRPTLAAALAVVAAVVFVSAGARANEAAVCDRSATPSTLASQVTAATAGQTICLASGSYGTWSGTNKAITLKAADGATASMRYAFTTGDSGFTLDGLSGMGGTITNGAHDITIKNSTFTSHAVFDGLANSNILFDHNTHNNINTGSG